MDNKALKLIKDYDKPSITMALMLIMELGKTEIINKDSKELFDSLKKVLVIFFQITIEKIL